MGYMSTEEFYNRLFDILDERGWSLYRLAKECGLSRSTLYNMKSRKNEPKLETFLKVVDGLQMTPNEFLYGSKKGSEEERWIQELETEFALKENETKRLADFVHVFVRCLKEDRNRT